MRTAEGVSSAFNPRQALQLTTDLNRVVLRSRNQLNFFTNLRTNPKDQIFVFFSDEKSVGVKTMRKCVSSLCLSGRTSHLDSGFCKS